MIEFYRTCIEPELLSAERCQLAVLKGTDVLYLAIQVGRGPFRFAAGNRFEASPRY